MFNVQAGFHRRGTAISIVLMSVTLLGGCDSSKPPQSPAGSNEIRSEGDALEAALVADPAQLKRTMQRCRDDRSSLDEAVCSAAARAHRKRFMGDGTSRYTPGSAAPADQ